MIRRTLFPFAVAADHRSSRVGSRSAREPRRPPELRRHLEFRDGHAARTAAELKDKPFFTPEEAAQWERQFARRNEEPPPDAAAKRTGTGTYNTFYREFGTRTVKTLRTSIITEPADGRIPALTPAAAEVKRRRLEGLKKFENPEDLGLQDQCLAFLTAGPPMLPYSYNSNYQIVQTKDAVRRARGDDPRREDHSSGRPSASAVEDQALDG